MDADTDAVRSRSAPRPLALPAMLPEPSGVDGTDAFRSRSAPRSLALPAMLPAPSGVDLLHDLVRHVVVRVDVLHVVEVLEGVDQAEHLAGAVLVELDLHA